MKSYYAPQDQGASDTVYAPKPKRKVWPWVLGLAALLLVGFVVMIVAAMGAGLNAAGQALASTGASGAVSGGQAGAEPVAAANTFEAGDYNVGTTTSASKKTLKPGTYVVQAVKGPCYWARVKSWDGELDSVIVNNNIDEGKSQNVTVKKTDKGLHLQGYCLLKP